MNKQRLHHIIFETDTKAGRAFDVALLWFILFSLLVVIIESIPFYGNTYKYTFTILEFVLTFIFSIEYLLRIYVSPKRLKYVFSFWGIIDLLSILPTYISFLFTGYHYLIVVRIFRLLRVFRILKLVRFHSESRILISALKASGYKIGVFFTTVVALVILLGTIMYVVEGAEKGFNSIPQSIYWAIVTITTVGYGDMVPHTVLGKIISSFAMILGYAIIAVPTGIMTVELSKSSKAELKNCQSCNSQNDLDANYCKSCGKKFG